MECGYARLTVWFEDPFWVGVYEREDGGRLEVCRRVFGAEPRDYEVYQWLLNAWRTLPFSPGIPAQARRAESRNPKRRQREAAASLSHPGTGTKAQQALQLQREQSKTQRQECRRQRDEAEQERKFRLRQAKRKEKRRGH